MTINYKVIECLTDHNTQCDYVLYLLHKAKDGANNLDMYAAILFGYVQALWDSELIECEQMTTIINEFKRLRRGN